MTAVRLVQAGAYDAAFEATVDADGAWTSESGTYVTRGRQARRLSAAERTRLAALVAALPAADPDDAAPPAGTVVTTLAVGARVWRWAGPPPAGPLDRLARWLVAPAG